MGILSEGIMSGEDFVLDSWYMATSDGAISGRQRALRRMRRHRTYTCPRVGYCENTVKRLWSSWWRKKTRPSVPLK